MSCQGGKCGCKRDPAPLPEDWAARYAAIQKIFDLVLRRYGLPDAPPYPPTASLAEAARRLEQEWGGG